VSGQVLTDSSVGYGGDPRNPRIRVERLGFGRYRYEAWADGVRRGAGRAPRKNWAHRQALCAIECLGIHTGSDLRWWRWVL
jgi:hypothetical protein